MGAKSVQSLWALAGDRARKQHGSVSRRQLLGMGFSDKAIKHALATRRLHPTEWRGVYALGLPQLTKHGRWMAAVLAYGDGTVLSHQSAGVLWRIWTARGREIHLSVPAVKRGRPRKGTTVHRRALPRRDITRERGIPVTTPIRTVIDLATSCDRRQAEALVNEADARGLVRADTLRAGIDRAAGQPGVSLLRDVLDRDPFVLTESELERLFLPLAREAGLPKPLTQVVVNGWRVDFYWPDLNLVVEVDGLRYHRTAAQQARDVLRDQAHGAAETEYVRFTYHQVARERAYVVRHLRLRAARASSRAAACA